MAGRLIQLNIILTINVNIYKKIIIVKGGGFINTRD